ncbi:MAG: polyprenyl synthetase family protein [Bacteroidales bacterium]|nr:polyprenyl synthetase family protein [Bacteroidales bacterium]MDT3356375.1 polyprenyl synthetase family protein [Bacteroidota bacterium]
MDKLSLKEYLAADLAKVSALMKESLASDIGLLEKTNEAIMQNSGKQLRPILVLLVAKACGVPTEDTYRFAAATELLHNATLLHDDVADNSPTRRGAPTTMSLLGSRASVLLGDFWLVKAVDRILEADYEPGVVIRLFARTLSDLAEGEMLQLQKASSCDTDEKDYLRIIYNKTASLFVAAARSAAISVHADGQHIEAVSTYAKALGLAFQIKDDIFDYQENAAIGKPSGQDLHERKITIPLLGALANVPATQAALIRRMVSALPAHPENQPLVVEFVKGNGGLEYAQSRLEDFLNEAREAIAVLPDSPEKDRLLKLTDFVSERES